LLKRKRILKRGNLAKFLKDHLLGNTWHDLVTIWNVHEVVKLAEISTAKIGWFCQSITELQYVYLKTALLFYLLITHWWVH